MDNKLSELKRRADKCPIKRFKAFIGKANTQATLCADTGIEIIGWSGFDASDLNAKSHRVELARFIAAADPETILAILAELEAKDKRIAELEAQVKVWESAATKHLERAEEAEKRLATPVRLLGEMLLHDWEHSVERQATFQHRKIAWDARLAEDKKAILAAGFTFTVEGDA
ncbi:ead/Ea22-like family protein [Serratia marcescens]|nr:ead/Ea22-like family protein [Serratia marcescens]